MYINFLINSKKYKNLFKNGGYFYYIYIDITIDKR